MGIFFLSLLLKSSSKEKKTFQFGASMSARRLEVRGVFGVRPTFFNGS